MILHYNIFNTSYEHNKIKIDHFLPIVYDGLGKFIVMF
jgi:hypothetical protein